MKHIKHAKWSAVLLLVVCIPASAQINFSKIQVGETLPSTLALTILGQKGKVRNLQEFRGDKLLIINLWATWCIPCVKEMRFLDSLKAQHPDKFNFLPVTRESEEVVDRFLKRPGNRSLSIQELQIAVNDTVLHRLFPHRGIPHNIWIDKYGTVRAITTQTAVTAENILNFKHGAEQKHMRIKEEIPFDPLAKRFSAGDTSFNYRSIITPRLKGIYGGGEMNQSDDSGRKRFFMWGGLLLRAYWSAYSGFNPNMQLHLMEVHTQDSLKFFHPAGEYAHLLKGSKYRRLDDWEDEHLYFYDLTLPRGVPDTVFRSYIFNDLERYFQVRAAVENRLKRCIVVTKTGAALPLSATSETGNPLIDKLPGYRISVKNATIRDVTDFLSRAFSQRPETVPDPYIIDMEREKISRFSIEMDFSKEVDSKKPVVTLNMVYKKLAALGFHFKVENRQYPVLILYDR